MLGRTSAVPPIILLTSPAHETVATKQLPPPCAWRSVAGHLNGPSPEALRNADSRRQNALSLASVSGWLCSPGSCWPNRKRLGNACSELTLSTCVTSRRFAIWLPNTGAKDADCCGPCRPTSKLAPSKPGTAAASHPTRPILSILSEPSSGTAIFLMNRNPVGSLAPGQPIGPPALFVLRAVAQMPRRYRFPALNPPASFPSRLGGRESTAINTGRRYSKTAGLPTITAILSYRLQYASLPPRTGPRGEGNGPKHGHGNPPTFVGASA